MVSRAQAAAVNEKKYFHKRGILGPFAPSPPRVPNPKTSEQPSLVGHMAPRDILTQQYLWGLLGVPLSL